ncbi:GAF domain-containing protein [Aureivirga marina]|uniref:GAF domain-containing protein n=1 Tax=Aureivirga marina TaxID=1182451 RepID=UPI0018CA9AD2|nr:GAF domain-containing protein [Aureivirga marina]
MDIIYSNNTKRELPVRFNIHFRAIYDYLQEHANDPKSVLYDAAPRGLKIFKDYPDLLHGFEDVRLLKKYAEPIDFLMRFLFPEFLETNEIKAGCVPFDMTMFKLSERFRNIVKNAGDDFELKIRNFDESKLYVMCCSFILSMYYGKNIDMKRPFFYDIPNVNENKMYTYRAAFNSDFCSIHKSDDAPELSEEDFNYLMDNFHDFDAWKEKVPANSYIIDGFGIMNLFDVTTEEIISNIHTTLLEKDDEAVFRFQEDLRKLMNIPDLEFGFSIINISEEKTQKTAVKNVHSLLFEEIHCECTRHFFCSSILNNVFNHKQIFTISDLETYGKKNDYNDFYTVLKKQDIQSFVLVPIDLDEEHLGIMELGSRRKHELNSVNVQKLDDILPLFITAVQRSVQEEYNQFESLIQEHYTSIHPSVKWRFHDAVENYLIQKMNKIKNAKLEDIVFDNVYPIYGQCDIKGSSVARNKAIQQDLIAQLEMAIAILKETYKLDKLPIYEELIFRINKYLGQIRKGIKSGDEVGITDFLKKDIYPVFNYIKTINSELKALVEAYDERIDSNVLVVYEKRKTYEDYVTRLNTVLADYIDSKQEEAQQMFPHYFERFKTDGVDFNMYIGQTLVRNKNFNLLYLHNLRLWQLQVICEMENLAKQLESENQFSLQIASLVLVHHMPLSIKFRMDEKQFDVNGAYNIRYEIIKKRIDKSLVKGTSERLTQPGKLAIVYTQDKEAEEYVKYIQFLQSKNYLKKDIEFLDIEDLQGIVGLKALRVKINYDKSIIEPISIDELQSISV